VTDAANMSVFRDSTFEYSDLNGNVFVTNSTNLETYTRWVPNPYASNVDKFIHLLNGRSGYIDTNGKAFLTYVTGTGSDPSLHFDVLIFRGIKRPIRDILSLTPNTMAVVA
jgi:hypothetical protein